MNPKAKVIHVALQESMTILGQPLKRMLFDGLESMPGIDMSLCQHGVLCKHYGINKGRPATWIIPFSRCHTIVLAEEAK
jgi:hypothetical protein